MPESTPMPVSVVPAARAVSAVPATSCSRSAGRSCSSREETMSQQVVLAGDRSTLPGPSPWTVTLGP